MNARLKQLWAGLAAFFLSQPPARRWTILGVGIASMAIVLGLAWWVQRPLYRPLFTNLSPHDAAAIVDALRAEKVAFQLEDGGRAVLVPAERLYELRLELASRGLPEGGGVGFEIFDRQTLGQTDFLERLNYQRALQGELGRTISQLGGVESARVHLALPERSLGVGRRQARAGPHARARPDRRHRAPRRGQRGGAGCRRGHRRRRERPHLDARPPRRRGARALGRHARVPADLRAQRRGPHREHARRGGRPRQGDRARGGDARLRARRAHRGGGRSRSHGAPAVAHDAGAVGRYAPDGGGGGRRDETQTYEVSKIVSRTVAPAGAVKQLSVAVLVDGTYEEKDGKRTFVPRAPEELERLKALVKSAAGLDEARGDKVEVASVPFQTEPLPAGEGVLGVVWRWLPAVVTRLWGLGFAVVMLLYVVRPLLLGLAQRPAAAGGAAGVVTEMDQAMLELAGETRALTQRNPERAAQLVRLWLAEAGGPPRG